MENVRCHDAPCGILKRESALQQLAVLVDRCCVICCKRSRRHHGRSMTPATAIAACAGDRGRPGHLMRAVPPEEERRGHGICDAPQLPAAGPVLRHQRGVRRQSGAATVALCVLCRSPSVSVELQPQNPASLLPSQLSHCLKQRCTQTDICMLRTCVGASGCICMISVLQCIVGGILTFKVCASRTAVTSSCLAEQVIKSAGAANTANFIFTD